MLNQVRGHILQRFLQCFTGDCSGSVHSQHSTVPQHSVSMRHTGINETMLSMQATKLLAQDERFTSRSITLSSVCPGHCRTQLGSGQSQAQVCSLPLVICVQIPWLCGCTTKNFLNP